MVRDDCIIAASDSREETEMSLRRLCRLGLHSDERLPAVDGESHYARCGRCGRERDIVPKTGA